MYKNRMIFIAISRWVAQLPRSGRSLYERSLRSAVRHEAISGGRIGICHGNGEVEIGPLGRTSSGEDRVWNIEGVAEYSGSNKRLEQREVEYFTPRCLSCLLCFPEGKRWSIDLLPSPVSKKYLESSNSPTNILIMVRCLSRSGNND